jgi:sigma-B regulation protein RsbU (phosphoserine phosphatase)
MGRLDSVIGLLKRPQVSHSVFAALWGIVLIAGDYLYDGAFSPWAIGLGLAPTIAGLVIFLVWDTGETHAWAALTLGEALGVALGTVLAARSGSPLMLMAMWPAAWAALRLPLPSGMAVVAGAALTHLAIGLWLAPLSGATAQAVLSTALYLITLYAAFILIYTLGRDGAAQTEEDTEASSAAQAPAPVDDALHQDLRVARDIQVSLLLASSPRLPGWEASTSFLPARQLGGDLYDFVEIDPVHRGLMIGDVTGKGIPAALHMAVARTLFRIEARQHSSPAEAMAQLNRSLIDQVPQGCVTLLYGHLNITDGSLRLANAGHNYPVILDDGVHELVLNGLPLGIDADYSYEEIGAHMKPGDVLVFFTDGVIEAMNEEGELFGFERLREILTDGTSRRPRTVTRQIVRAVRSFTGGTPQSDDITLVVLRRRYLDQIREMTEVARDVLGVENGNTIRDQLIEMGLPSDAPAEVWRAAIMTLGGSVRDRLGQGPSRELLQQLFLTLESF